MEPGELKKEQRAHARAAMAALDAANRADFSTAICRRLAGIELWNQAQAVSIFSPLPGEPDPGWPDPLPDGRIRQVALPKIRHDPAGIELRVVTRHSDLVKARADQGWMLLEPPEQAPRIDPARIEIALIPGRAFDRRGGRLGRGGGYYDRLLGQLPESTLCIGLFFAAQELAEVCEEAHDRRLDMILTEKEAIVLPP